MKKCLIVDDEEQNRYLLDRILQGFGYKTAIAENGAEALDKARQDPPDLIISDILMPVMDGYALCREWKSDDHLKHIPLVFYTATYTEPKDEAFALSLGAARFIIKPQEPGVLMNIIKEVLEENYEVKQVAAKPLGEEMEFFRQHNEILFKKLEKKMLDLERANQKLKCLEEQYRLSFENITDVVWTIDSNFIIPKVSPSVEKMLGYKPQDLIGHNFSDCANIVTADSMERAVAEINLIFTGTTIPASVYSLIKKDGTEEVVEVGGSPILSNGKIVGAVFVMRDITERKRNEKDREKMMVLRQGVNTLQQSLLAPGTLKEKFKEITDSTVRLFDADFCRIWLIQPGDLCEQGCVHADVKEGPHICKYRDRCLHLMASSGRYTHTDGIVHRRVPFGCYKIGRVASDHDHKFLTNDAQNDPRVHNHEWARELGLVSFAGYQLRIPGGKTLGVLALFSKYPIQAREDAILDGISSTTALVIQRDHSEKSLNETLKSLRKAVGATIQVMVSAVETRDPYTSGHQTRSAGLARAIATEMGLPPDTIEGIHIAGSIHDIGKLSTPAEILSKPTRLSAIELSLIQEHSLKGYEILKDVESPWPLAQIVYQHHERMDGSGYPRNLKGDEILIEARILTVADVVEAMASHRPYRPGLGINAALDEIEQNKGILYDAVVADACLKLFKEKGYKIEG